MPRRNEGGSARKGTPRPGAGRSPSGKGTPRGKSFKKESRSQDSKKNYGTGKSSASGSGKPKASGSYKRSGPEGPSKKPFGSSFSTPGKKAYGQKSRFARPTTPEGPRPAPSKFSRNESRNAGKDRGGSFGKPYKKTYKARPDRVPPGGHRRRINADVEAAPKSDKVRLNKFIANSGISSRREADELIKMGLISVNGKIVSELGYKVNPGDEVRYEDKVLRAEKPVYILMNKPKGFITTTDDPQERKTVMHIVGSSVKERIYPVGRLDRNTTGLLLLTNDGDLADKLMHPSFNVRKVYKVELNRALTKADFQAIVEGVRLEEGRAMVDDLAIVSEDGKTVGLELHIGWNRVVRRIFESLGYEVMKLDRTVYAGLDKKELSRGQWRFLSKEEIIHLKHFK